MKRILSFIALLALSACSTPKSTAGASTPALPALKSVASLDVQRYLGTWFEVASYPMFFQRMCKANTQAKYAQGANNEIYVLNSCDNDKGEKQTINGKAWAPEANNPAQLKVTFLPDWISWVPVGRANYWVVGLSDNSAGQYRYAIVSNPSRELLWILSRTPKLSAADQQAAMAQIKQLGFESERLKFTPQN
jgi:apolipoprotein D and lipocalin family protein